VRSQKDFEQKKSVIEAANIKQLTGAGQGESLPSKPYILSWRMGFISRFTKEARTAVMGKVKMIDHWRDKHQSRA